MVTLLFLEDSGILHEFHPLTQRRVGEIALQESQGIRDLSARARALFDRAAPPDGAAGCEDCRKLAEIWKLLN